VHRLLARQLKKLGLSQDKLPSQQQWAKLLTTIEKSYEASDQDRYTLERSLTLSSEEMQVLYQKQKDTYESRLESILNAMPDVLFLLNEDIKCLEVMSGNKRILKDNISLALGKYAHEVFPEDKARLFKDAVTRALTKDNLVVVHYELDINGETHYFEGRVMPTNYVVDGQRTAVFIAIDITKRVKADVQSQIITTMFDSSREGMLILNNKLEPVSYNKAFCDLTGETPDTVESGMSALVKRLFSSSTGNRIKESMMDDGYWIGEVTGYHKSGESYPLWLSINKVRCNTADTTNYVVMLSDVSELKRSQEELEHVATHDALTNLPNRILFQDRLEQAIIRTHRNDTLGALFFLDLDRFKNINDNLGHLVGDDLLMQAAQRLKQICRSSDTLARIGGDEFTVIVEDLHETDELAFIAQKILNAFKEPFALKDYKLEISVSIGISIFPQDSEDPVEIIKHADTAMYSAKELGRNTYQFYTQELTSSAFEYFATEIALRKALENNEFFLLYQPQFNLESNELIGVEALVRWRHPDMGIVSPAAFIHIAETNGQIIDIGRWVIAEASRQCSVWKAQGMPDLTVSVNISRKQLVVPNFADDVSAILEEEGLDGCQLEFEITESSIIENKGIAYDNLNNLKAMGINMAIDDFGTGYSSLINLKQFPLTRLKIDQSFVRDVTKDPNDEAIIRATIALAKSLQLRVIAEGVETENQRKFLLMEGCDEAQGYFYSQPVEADEIIERYLHHNHIQKSVQFK
jgi:diguanylate cyclase (GGDEF)-like protein/PAS domain S-box-containing protein